MKYAKLGRLHPKALKVTQSRANRMSDHRFYDVAVGHDESSLSRPEVVDE